jgi:hypothetical protein
LNTILRRVNLTQRQAVRSDLQSTGIPVESERFILT